MTEPMMKSFSLIAGLSLTLSAAVSAAPLEASTGQFQIYPKNLARHHMGSNVFIFNGANQTFVPTEAAAAWLDDDIATGWPATTGQQYYLISMAQADLITNFQISARGTNGTISLYAGDEPAPPTSKSWTPLAKDLDIESINQKRLSKGFSRFAKYVLIETNLTDSGPWYSIYLYGEKPASSFSLRKRSEPINTASVYKFVNDQTSINLSSLYTQGRVASGNSGDSMVGLQKAIDDNPESSISLAASDSDAGIAIQLREAHPVQRISVLTDGRSKGRMDFYVAKGNGSSAASGQSDYLRAAYGSESTAAQPGTSTSLAGLSPAATIVFDGSNPRGSTDFSPAEGSTLLVKWTPDVAGEAIEVREVNAFGDVGVSNYEFGAPLEAVAEITGYDGSKDGKTFLPSDDTLPPVGESLPPKTPFVSGPPPVPPFLTLSH